MPNQEQYHSEKKHSALWIKPQSFRLVLLGARGTGGVVVEIEVGVGAGLV